MDVPRKLVRGQDVWLGKGQEQTRQILKCMWCGESFKSLAELTEHMTETQHYTKVISQEQLSSWRNNNNNNNTEANAEQNKRNSAVDNPTLSCQVSKILLIRVDSKYSGHRLISPLSASHFCAY